MTGAVLALVLAASGGARHGAFSGAHMRRQLGLSVYVAAGAKAVPKPNITMTSSGTVSATGAHFAARVTPNGADTTYRFRYATVGQYVDYYNAHGVFCADDDVWGPRWPTSGVAGTVPGANAVTDVSSPPIDLSAGTDYYFCGFALSAGGAKASFEPGFFSTAP